MFFSGFVVVNFRTCHVARWSPLALREFLDPEGDRRMRVYIINQGFFTSQVVVWDFRTINSRVRGFFPTPPGSLTANAPEKWWLEDNTYLLGR